MKWRNLKIPLNFKKKIMAIFAVCKQFRLDTTELLKYTRGEQTLGAKRLDGETTSWETQKPGFFVTCLLIQ